ncbi:dTMP kinase [Endozoicomonas numazuensis]|uniref:Thymidylate kinase n=1 Tax=Endozoicomonas numazuensis TaxID=1137799 RepID=A0A081N406_9GAMM|nr:dTMP kinase [Endozoicomonas numazuensis]KEQ13179.1 thymidylate kinase [Endozoicomonas numazuensis]
MANAPSGFFLTIEGGEGAGKTTAVDFIKHWMSDRQLAFTETREPGGTQVAEELRALLLGHHGEPLSDITELLMMFAARSQNLFHNILPGLEAGEIVLCDRFTDATYAYQGGGRGLNTQPVETLENLVQGALRPDMTILLDVDPEIGMARAKGRSGELDRIEQEKMDFFIRVRNAYLERARQFPEQFEVIDAGQSLEGVQKQLLDVLERRLGAR